MNKIKYLLILALLISFGSIGAVVFTPGLPDIAKYFNIDDQIAGLTVTWYLAGYAFGQLLYGPLANRFGGRMTISIGCFLAIIGSIGCIAAYPLHSFYLLVIARTVMALGAACGLKMTFTLSGKLFSTEENARVLGLLTMAFAITPGLGVFLGGILVTHFNWSAPFYLMVLYGIIILWLNHQIPDVYARSKSGSLSIANIGKNYVIQLKNRNVLFGGMLVGLGTCIVYIFASISPFIAINIMHLSPGNYGAYNFIPSAGILVGSLCSNHLGKVWSPAKSLKFGLMLTLFGGLLLLVTLSWFPSSALSLFLPMILLYIGLSFIFGNGAALALKNAKDTGNASAMMSFINMGSAFFVVMVLGELSIQNPVTLPIIYLILGGLGIVWYRLLKTR